LTPDTAKTERDRLESTHDLYQKYSPHWRFYVSAYEGGPDFLTKENLFRHVRENADDHTERHSRIHNLNYCEPLVDFFSNFIFSETIERNVGESGKDAEFYKMFTADVTRRGDSVDAFMRQVADDMQIYGMTYVLVDAPRINAERPLTVAEESANGIRPYWVSMSPLEVTDWVYDEFGKLLYLKRRQEVSLPSVVGKEKVVKFTEFYRERYVISIVRKTAKGYEIQSETIEHSHELIPVEVIRFKRSKIDPEMGVSFLRDLAGNNREVLNLTSLLQEFLYRQAFNILATEVDTALPQLDQSEGTVGTSNSIAVPKGASMPQYISPPVAPAQAIQDERTRIIGEMYKRAAQDTASELFNGESSSGFSQAQSFSKTVPFISTRAETLEEAETHLMVLTMKMMGREWHGKIRYKDRYEITNLTDALTQLSMIMNDLGLLSETFIKEEFKRIIVEFDGKLPRELMDKIFKEIMDIDFDEWKKDRVPSKGSAAAQHKPKSTGTMQEVAQEAKVSAPSPTKKLKTD
jgi:hypothetical protein